MPNIDNGEARHHSADLLLPGARHNTLPPAPVGVDWRCGCPRSRCSKCFFARAREEAFYTINIFPLAALYRYGSYIFDILLPTICLARTVRNTNRTSYMIEKCPSLRHDIMPWHLHTLRSLLQNKFIDKNFCE